MNKTSRGFYAMFRVRQAARERAYSLPPTFDRDVYSTAATHLSAVIANTQHVRVMTSRHDVMARSMTSRLVREESWAVRLVVDRPPLYHSTLVQAALTARF